MWLSTCKLNPLLVTSNDEEREIHHLVAQALDKVGAYLPREMLLSAALQSEHWGYVERRYKPSSNVMKVLYGKYYEKRWTSPPHVTEALRWMKEDVPTNLLLLALHDKDDEVRYKAAVAMTDHVWQGPLEPLVACLHTETDDYVLQKIVQTLGEFLQGAEDWINFYNQMRPHQGLEYRSPDQFADDHGLPRSEAIRLVTSVNLVSVQTNAAMAAHSVPHGNEMSR